MLLTKKQRKKSPENNTPSPYRVRGNNDCIKINSTVRQRPLKLFIVSTLRSHDSSTCLRLISDQPPGGRWSRPLHRLGLQTGAASYIVQLLITPPPVGGRGIVFARFLCLFVSFFVSLFLCQQHYEKTAGPICVKFSGRV